MESCNLNCFIDPFTEELSIWSHLDLILFVSVRLLRVRVTVSLLKLYM